MLPRTFVTPMVKTRSGKGCLWERVIEEDNVRHSMVITNSIGGKKRPIFVHMGQKQIPQGEGVALFPIDVGDYIVCAKENSPFDVVIGRVKQVLDITEWDIGLVNPYPLCYAEFDLVQECVNGVWGDMLVDMREHIQNIQYAINAAVVKIKDPTNINPAYALEFTAKKER